MTTTATPETNQIRITRLYDAPVALVWEAWTDLKHVAQWWGPRGFTITTHHKDLRPGGSWTYTMHGPDGKDWPNFARYHEVVPRARLVYDHGATSEDTAPLFHVTALFRDVGGKTELDMTMTLPTPEAATATKAFIKQVGGNSTWDRLAEYLEAETAKRDIFVINRSFEAPIATMFDLWTRPEHFAKWLPPTGFTMEFRRSDIRAGGSAFYGMTNGQFTMYGCVQYLELRRPDRLRYVQWFTDAEEKISRHPGAPVWPEKMLTTVTFTAEGPAQTRVMVRWEPYGNATREEVAAFVAARAGITQGWTGSFDKLEDVVAALPTT
ncbi:MAG: SRPBCC domain-containing protein [Gemmatimonadetes bacterium]|nr:SRPBCC domain-containing protein [Gemmatimonadota bacterium]